MLRKRITADGIHLFDRTSGMNILLDEYRLDSSLHSDFPSQFSIALTNSCNLNCPFCYVEKSDFHLNFKELISWIDEIDTSGALGVGFGGGEPSLYKNFTDICKYVMMNTQLAVTFTTNAISITTSLANKLEGNVNFIRVSMDGIGATYRTMRGIEFNTFIEHLNIIKRISDFGINYIVNSTTIGDLDKAFDFALKNGAAEFLLLPEYPAQGRRGIDKETENILHQWIISYNHEIPLSISRESAIGLPTCHPFVHEKPLQSFAHIDAFGIIKKTSFDYSGIKINDLGIKHALKKLAIEGDK